MAAEERHVSSLAAAQEVNQDLRMNVTKLQQELVTTLFNPSILFKRCPVFPRASVVFPHNCSFGIVASGLHKYTGSLSGCCE